MRYPALVAVLAAAPTLTSGQTPSSKPPTGQTTPAQSAPAKPRSVTPATTGVKPPSSLEVVVQDSRGKPVAGALVTLVAGRELLPRGRIARTDAEGRVRIEDLPRPPWDIGVQARGLAPKRVERLDGTKPAVVRLEPGASITGVVLDGATRAPAAGANVWAWVRAGLGAERWEPESGRVSTTCDARGRFKLEGLAAGTVSVTATAPGLGRATRQSVLVGSAVDLYLQPGSTIAGSVRDEAGRAVKGAVVRVTAETPMQYLPPSERTDARGRFAIAGLDAGSYVVAVRAPTLAPAVSQVSVDGKGETGVELTLAEGGFASGRLVDGTPRPTSGRLRIAVVDGVTLPQLVHDLVQAEAGSDGRFVLGPLPSGDLTLEARAPGLAPREVEVRLSGRPPSADLGDIALESGLVLRGAVRDGTGTGIPGAFIIASSRGQDRPIDATTEDDGSFVLAGLKARQLNVFVRAPGFAPIQETLTVGDDDVVLVLESGGTIVGSVVDAKGQPVPGASLFGELENPDRSLMVAPPYATADEGEGRFTMRDARPGRYAIVASARGHASGNVSGVRVTAGATTDAGIIRLRAGGTVRGTVKDSAGEPVPGANVRIEADGMSRPLTSAAQSDGTGAFELNGVPPGRVNVRASHPAYAPGRVSGVVVEAEAAPAEAHVVMSRGGRIEGVARLRSGPPLAGARVTVGPRRSGPMIPPGMDGPYGSGEQALVQDDGSFAIERVAPGPSVLMLLMAGGGMEYSGTRNVMQREIDVREGETTIVDLQAREVLVSGRLTRRGEPVPGVSVTFTAQSGGMNFYFGGPGARPSSASGPQPMAGTTRADGSYELLVFEPGRYSATARGADSITPLRSQAQSTSTGPASAAYVIEVPDVATHQVDFTLGSATLSGVVIEEETEKPVARAFVSLTGKVARGNGMADAEGRFSFDIEPGEGQLRVNAQGYVPFEQNLSVPEGGTDGLRLAISRGREITGRVQDASGRLVGEVDVTATGEKGWSGYARALPDGSFRLRGLVDGAHNIMAGSPAAGYGSENGVSAGATGVVVRIRPASTLRVRVVNEAGQPVAKAVVRMDTLGGARVSLPGGPPVATDASGMAELVAPEGLVALNAQAEGGQMGGLATVECHGGATATVEIVLKDKRAQR